jgi:benzoyl-CoA 2,3-dioxygenase component B
MRLRDDFVDDANAGVARWNRVLERAGVAYRLCLPHVAFNRRIGEFAAIHADAEGNLLSDDQWAEQKEAMLPSADDNRFVESLMRPVHAPGAYASWIAPPLRGIDNRPGDFEYVKIEA